jgi:hypothetical protein
LEDGRLIAEGEMPPGMAAQLRLVQPDLLRLLRQREAAQLALTAVRPTGAREAEWGDALAGLKRFLDELWAAQALCLGWSLAQLFSAPARWSQIHLTGAALLVGRWSVLDVDAEAITVKSPWSESQLKLYRSRERAS